MNIGTRTIQIGIVVGILATAFFTFLAFNNGLDTTTIAGDYWLIQDEPEVNLLPNTLQRLSWGAIIAGTLITLVVMFLLNLIGIAIGLTQVNPEQGQESADSTGLAMGSMGWIVVSNFVALFIGGWLAAYFAGIPEPMDGFLHGIMVWALSGIITTALVMTGVGRVMSGLAGLLNSGLSMTGSVASGATQVTSSAVQTAGGAVGSASSMTAQMLSTLAGGVQNSAQVMGSGMSSATDTAIENSPDVQNALQYQDLSFEEIKLQAKSLMRDAGKSPEQVEQQVNAAVGDVKAAAKQAVKNPQDIQQIVDITLQRLMRRGEQVATDVDRQSLIKLLDENTDLSQEEINEHVNKWEQQFNEAKSQTKQARELAKQKAEEFRLQAEQKAQELYQEAQTRAEDMQLEAETRLKELADESETRAREAAQVASDAFTKIAGGIAVAMVLSAIAAGLGGFLGTPQGLPDVPLDEAAAPQFNHIALVSSVLEQL